MAIGRWLVLGTVALAAGGARGGEEVRTVETALRCARGAGPLADAAKEIERQLPLVGSIPSRLARYFDDETLPPP